MKLLFDASSIFNLLVIREPASMISQYTLDFSRYEVLNVVWKHYTLLKTYNRETLDALLHSTIQLLSEMNSLTIIGVEQQAMETAVTNGISFYDSAYIILAKENKCTLVTEDKRMTIKARESHVSVISIKDI